MSALRKVLVVDDDPVVGASFTRVLSGKGYAVITAQNAAQALEQLRQQEVDLVYTDIRMPGMDGLELAQQLQTKRPWTPVIIITGHGSRAHEERARAAGVSAFLNKPLSPEMMEESADLALLPRAPAALVPVLAPAVAAAPRWGRALGDRLKNVALFLAAPFIGLLYALMLPFVGIAMLAWTALQAFRARP